MTPTIPANKRYATMRTAVLLACLMLSAIGFGSWARATAQDPLTPQQRRGKQIYLQGTSASGKEILAYLGDASLEVPGSAMACANCHGLDGQGKPEGGIIPSNLTREVLTKPFGLAQSFGRKRPPYTDRGLELAIKRGTDPGGNKLQNVMPRYEMTGEDMADLLAYMERLGKDSDPGISDSRIVIGSVLPAKGALGEMGEAIKAVNAAFFEELNSRGGIYNRRLELKVAEAGNTPAETRVNVEGLLKDEQIFAMTGAFMAGSEKELVPLMAQQEVPLIGPFTLYPQTGTPLNRQVFYLLAGIDGQARALVDFAANRPDLKKARVVVAYPQSDMNSGVVAAIKDQCKKAGLSEPQPVEYTSGHFEAAATAGECKEINCGAVFFLGNADEAQAFMKEAEKLSLFPSIFLPGSGASAGVFSSPIGFDGKVFLSFPTSPAAQNADGRKEYQALAEKYKLPSHHLAAQLSAYTADKILVEALKRTGRDLSREKLIQSLEGLYEYATGLTPAISYGPNRRIGANGAYVVTINLKEKEFVPASGWLEVN